MAVAGTLKYDTKLDTKDYQKGLDKISSASKTAFKGMAIAGTLATTAIASIVTLAVKSYAEYEQLVGGVDTLFKDSSKKVQEYANEAYKTAGLSANAYMSTITSFSASLLQGLDGDTVKASEYANQAIIDMSDNANKMGTDITMIQNAYQGFAKQNYMMLDNLKLGYGGTKTEMERLIEDANKVKVANGEMGNLSIESFADVTKAINIMQTELGITGTTAKEASTTITGSLGAMQSAWNNLLTGISDANQDTSELIDNLIGSVSTFGENILPVIEQALIGVGDLIETLFPVIMERIPQIIDDILPSLINSGLAILQSLLKGIQDNLPLIVSGTLSVILTLLTTVIEMLPQIIEMGITVLIELMNGITQTIPKLIPVVMECIKTILKIIIDNLPLIINAGIDLLLALILGIVDAIPELIDTILDSIGVIIATLLRPDMLTKLIMAGVQILVAVIVGLIQAIPKLIFAIPKIFVAMIKGFATMDWKQIGMNMLQGIVNGFTNIGNIIWNAIKKVGNSMLSGIKKFFGIASPSKLMADKIGKFIPAGIGVGIEANTDSALDAIDDMNDEIMNKMKQAVNIETAKSSFSGTSGSVSQILTANGTTTVNLNNETYLDGEKVYENQKTVTAKKNLQYQFA
jgi:phage-related protein